MSKINELNFNQLRTMDLKLRGCSEKNNNSIFQEVESLDTNTNKTIDNNESLANKLLALGKQKLINLAEKLGISTEADNAEPAGEDNEMANIKSNYIDAVNEYYNEYKNGTISADDFMGIVGPEMGRYMIDGILSDKLAAGHKIVSEENGTYTFDDGSAVSIYENDDMTEFEYSKQKDAFGLSSDYIGISNTMNENETTNFLGFKSSHEHNIVYSTLSSTQQSDEGEYDAFRSISRIEDISEEGGESSYLVESESTQVTGNNLKRKKDE